MCRLSYRVLVLSACALLWLGAGAAAQSAGTGEAADAARLRSYIRASWQALSRSMTECKSVVDPKVTTVPVLYLPAGLAEPAEVRAMESACHVDVRHLPRPITQLGEVRPTELAAEGLLYLPHRYVVPGGRFNEMYGWDSYFILLGLVEDGETQLARGMVENFFFEIENYGAVLNANRTYFFTRSQPPFLSSMIREVYEHPGSAAPLDKAWLRHAYALATRDYALWVSPMHRAGTTGLARYYDVGAGPVPEMADDSSYFPDVIRWLLKHPDQHPEYLVPAGADADAGELSRLSCDGATSRVCAQAVVEGRRLSAAFFASDRAMRESGFDTSFRFGPFSGSTAEFAPVCLNSLLFKYENDMAHLAEVLGKAEDVPVWRARAAARRAAIDRYLWDAARGTYMDFDYGKGERSTYEFVTAFYPLWAGAASAAQAASVEKHVGLFNRAGGMATSTYESGVQWDMPFGWAPTNWLAAEGLLAYGYGAEARGIAREFSATVLANFVRDGTVREKYNVVDGSANVKVAAGYKSNVVGFGWTNGVYLKFADLLAGGAK